MLLSLALVAVLLVVLRRVVVRRGVRRGVRSGAGFGSPSLVPSLDFVAASTSALAVEEVEGADLLRVVVARRRGVFSAADAELASEAVLSSVVTAAVGGALLLVVRRLRVGAVFSSAGAVVSFASADTAFFLASVGAFWSEEVFAVESDAASATCLDGVRLRGVRLRGAGVFLLSSSVSGPLVTSCGGVFAEVEASAEVFSAADVAVAAEVVSAGGVDAALSCLGAVRRRAGARFRTGAVFGCSCAPASPCSCAPFVSEALLCVFALLGLRLGVLFGLGFSTPSSGVDLSSATAVSWLCGATAFVPSGILL